MKLGRLEGGTDWLVMWTTHGGGDLQRCRAKLPPDGSLDFTPADGHDTAPLNRELVRDIVGKALDDDQIRAISAGG